jgi:ergothioneine biosynthesis protein EgtB
MTYNPDIRTVDQLLQKYQAVRAYSLEICSPLEPEDYVVQPIIDVSPPKWHLGHTTWFFENFILVEHVEGYTPYDEQLNYYFNSYYESQGPRILRSHRGNITRPGLSTIIAYREHVDQQMAEFLQAQPDQYIAKSLFDLINLGLQHEQQHQELLYTDIKYILGHNPMFPNYKVPEHRESVPARPSGWLALKEGVYEIGHQGEGFCFDNELNRHKTYISACAVQDRLVTNGEYLAFIEAGGYERFEYWLSDGWAWVSELDVKAPEYWFERDGQWWQFTLRGLQPVDPNLPVTHISYYEADAYARWRELRLPTEQEWEVACQKYGQAMGQEQGFAEGAAHHPQAAAADDYQFLGHCWEWTGSAYLPYPGYPRLKGALGEYNGKFMVNQMVLRGGSCATPISHIRMTYRNFFQPDKRWQFTGIRLAKDL